MKLSLRRHPIVQILLVLLTAGVLLIVAAAAVPMPPVKPYSPVVRDRHGELLGAFLARDGMWRLQTSAKEIPPRLKSILIQKEDRFFYRHPGVNPIAVLRAMVQNLAGGKRISGASTITMQVARMLEPKRRTYVNKLAEMFRALQLELRYSKEEILELYLSLIPLGGNIDGLSSASLLYYQTPLERLNIAQLIDLILIPNDPNDLRPDRNAERLLTERIRHANAWRALGYLTREDSLVVAQTEAKAERKPLAMKAPQFALRVKSQQEQSSEVTTTLDFTMQRSIERLLDNHMREWRQRGVLNGAVLVVDNRTMEVRAYIGSPDFSDTLGCGQVDAVRAVRSPGSTLKPFLYAVTMDRGVLTPKSRLLDVPYDVEGYSAENYDGTWSGWVYADEALRRSLNIPMIRLLRETGVGPFVDLLRRAGMKSLESQEANLGLSMIVGGCGVSLEELVAAYAAFPRSGTMVPLRFVLDTSSLKATRVFSDAAAFMVTDILSGIDRPDLPNNFESAVNKERVAFKTGTSYGRRDAWCIGYTSEYTVGVWIGNVTNIGCPELAGNKAATPLLIDIFNAISHAPRKHILDMPQDVNTRDVCAESGKLPLEHCNHLIEDYYSISHTLNLFCTVEKELVVSADGRKQYCASCQPASNYRTIVFKDYPPELFGFWKKIGRRFTVAPKHNPLCGRFFAGEGPHILSPSNDMAYLLTSEDTNIAFQASSGVDIREHVWYLNGKFLGRRKAGEKFFLALDDGEYSVSCADEKGRISTVKVRVKHL